jgi:transcriptional regulator with XRE-family HTH domain
MGRGKGLRVRLLGAKLKRIRTALGLTQAEMLNRLAAGDSVYQSHISEYELDKREPPLPVLLKYARLAKLSTDELIDDEIELKL